MAKEIELEIRAEIAKDDFAAVLNKLKARGKFRSKTKRLSVMFFGTVGDNTFDIRVRVTNGNCEIVLKKGLWHAHNREETAQAINKDQFLGVVKIFSQFGFVVKVGERETHNFEFRDGIVLSLVRAGNISYLEIEKMSTREDEAEDIKELRKIAYELAVEIISGSEQLDALCDRLSLTVDWDFSGSEADFERLKKAIDDLETKA